MSFKERDLLYRLIIRFELYQLTIHALSQLFYDGFQTMAVNLVNLVSPSTACGPSNRLFRLVKLGLASSEEEQEKGGVIEGECIAPGTGIDLEVESESSTMAPEAALYETCYVTAHKAACRAAAFNGTGQLVATGSHDSSIKILDVERMLAKSVSPADHLGQETPQQQMETHPVIRTLYDHTAEVTCVDFHPDPTLQILVSGSKDYTIKLFDFSNPSVKKAQRNIPEASPIRTLHFHPSGNFLLVGTQHKTLRLYDVQTCRCYVSAVPEDQHQSSVNMVRWSPNGNAFVTAGMDGNFKIWDGVSCRCVNTFEAAHDGAPVCSAMFSRNGKYILSSGKDSAVKLWEIATGRCLITYTGAGTTGHQTHRSMAVFNHTEDYDLFRISHSHTVVLFPDEATKSLCCWDSRNADRQRLLALNHNGPIRCFVHSPTTAAFMSCSDDNRARFWYKRPISD
ncbi:WD domain, G-beta repeat protein [Opisthorchis viverrini]|uniref:Cleavage stimulation factor 50 kDa subunit n=1 Tax=Opisthorchis viverrini TaxID=6198 RepID=A0A1S8X7G9_OPIVI|nr:WD domain, G-beta repeat protein [Opisthorchis viverrini]